MQTNTNGNPLRADLGLLMFMEKIPYRGYASLDMKENPNYNSQEKIKPKLFH